MPEQAVDQVLCQEEVAAAFRYAGDVLFVDSPLYRLLAGRIAEDAELLALAALARPGQSPVLLLLAAVHFRTRRGAAHPLTAIYGDLARGQPAPLDTVWECFVDFCRAEREGLAEFVAGSRVQTNELGRAVLLRLGAEWLAERFRPEAISWLELGASAGLNLYWDQFAIEYRRPPRRFRRGDAASGVRLGCELTGGETPVERQVPLPRLAERLGTDIAPLDVADPEAFDRLAAFVWADQWRRLERLRCAAELCRRGSHLLCRADATREVVSLSHRLRPETLLCVAHSFLSSQLPAAEQSALEEQLAAVSRERELVRVAVEWVGDGTQLEVERWTRGRRAERRVLAQGHPHGRTLRWCA